MHESLANFKTKHNFLYFQHFFFATQTTVIFNRMKRNERNTQSDIQNNATANDLLGDTKKEDTMQHRFCFRCFHTDTTQIPVAKHTQTVEKSIHPLQCVGGRQKNFFSACNYRNATLFYTEITRHVATNHRSKKKKPSSSLFHTAPRLLLHANATRATVRVHTNTNALWKKKSISHFFSSKPPLIQMKNQKTRNIST